MAQVTGFMARLGLHKCRANLVSPVHAWSLPSGRCSPHSWQNLQTCCSSWRVRRSPKSTICAGAASHAGPAFIFSASWLLSAGIFLLGAAVAAIALSAIPLLLELRQAAKRMQTLADIMEKEIPETAATMRLTGLEMADAIHEVSLLSLDITGGLQASARLMQDAEKGIRSSTGFVMSSTAQTMLPAIRQCIPAAKGHLEEVLIKNQGLSHNSYSVLQLVTAARVAATRIRTTLTAVRAVRTVSHLLPKPSR